ncbi:hypothetical protein QQS21_000717 [Conoideocrella luteorostrata]|uniref:Uncharacterized protein n=1 Tax=Conoideocrella luteorostrata TaxID=1105319 RepID=A0AAJ0G3T9_9HYPO|nr:hypothetical protein QQS21_000717 [Conoideocrella luteorostrata]
MFEVSSDGSSFTNLVTATSYPTQPPIDTALALRNLGEIVEEDMFLLKPTSAGHRLVAYVCCFPSGFDPSEKLGKLLKDIHGPVPGYEKIGPSMERFFCKLEAGKPVKRTNTFLRCELQTLSRLARSQNILFNFKTYQYNIADIKAEGRGNEFADAIEGLKKGNVPDMWKYKGAPKWAVDVCKYLR